MSSHVLIDQQKAPDIEPASTLGLLYKFLVQYILQENGINHNIITLPIVLVTNTKDHGIWQHSTASKEDVAFIESKLSKYCSDRRKE
eukprot:10151632-Ditylum_brightwellii.AAC.1